MCYVNLSSSVERCKECSLVCSHSFNDFLERCLGVSACNCPDLAVCRRFRGRRLSEIPWSWQATPVPCYPTISPWRLHGQIGFPFLWVFFHSSYIISTARCNLMGKCQISPRGYSERSYTKNIHIDLHSHARR